MEDQNLKDKSIIIIGPRQLQNALITYFLVKETGARCLALDNFHALGKTRDKGPMPPYLILMDWEGKDLETGSNDLDSMDQRIFSKHLVALFNVSHTAGIEEQALARRTSIKGFFYDEDPLNQILKGIHAIFRGELWVSRDVLARCLLESRDRGHISKKGAHSLTAREVEILLMMAAGAKNEDIAEKLYVSPNTVKTHIYNIFKKINVPNRLQAALWAAKHL